MILGGCFRTSGGIGEDKRETFLRVLRYDLLICRLLFSRRGVALPNPTDVLQSSLGASPGGSESLIDSVSLGTFEIIVESVSPNSPASPDGSGLHGCSNPHQCPKTKAYAALEPGLSLLWKENEKIFLHWAVIYRS